MVQIALKLMVIKKKNAFLQNKNSYKKNTFLDKVIIFFINIGTYYNFIF